MTSDLILGTNVVRMDEACFSLKEINQPSPDSRSVRRYQCIRVMRNDRIAEMRRDLGPADSFTATEFVIPGGVRNDATGRIEIVETVGRLVDIAELLRSDVYHRPEPPRGIDLVQKYREMPDKRRRRRKAMSQFGPGFKVERA